MPWVVLSSVRCSEFANEGLQIRWVVGSIGREVGRWLTNVTEWKGFLTVVEGDM